VAAAVCLLEGIPFVAPVAVAACSRLAMDRVRGEVRPLRGECGGDMAARRLRVTRMPLLSAAASGPTLILGSLGSAMLPSVDQVPREMRRWVAAVGS